MRHMSILRKKLKFYINGGDNMKFKGGIVITDPCYVVNDEDWEFSEYGDRMDKLGFTDYLVRSTIVGDGF